MCPSHGRASSSSFELLSPLVCPTVRPLVQDSEVAAVAVAAAGTSFGGPEGAASALATDEAAVPAQAVVAGGAEAGGPAEAVAEGWQQVVVALCLEYQEYLVLKY